MRITISLFALFILAFQVQSCTGQVKESHPLIVAAEASQSEIQKIEKSEAEWRAELSDQEFYVLRKKGTERAFTGTYWDNKEKGMYTCAACGFPLFSSETKFKSGTGWPSYYEPIEPANIAYVSDRTAGMVRTEVLCARCDGHLGHVFPDGPEPTGLRYCINSVSLKFEATEQK